jgi:hypothetical protein
MGSYDDEDIFWEVEAAIGKRTTKQGDDMYLIRWKGYTAAHDTWEPIRKLNVAFVYKQIRSECTVL